MSTFWIWFIWGSFWGSIIVVMIAIFKDVAHRDREAEAYREFQSWDSNDLDQLIMSFGPVAQLDEGLQVNVRVAMEVLRKRENDQILAASQKTKEP